MDYLIWMNVFSLIMLAWQLNICWWPVTLVPVFLYLLAEIVLSQMEDPPQSLLVLFDYLNAINIHTFPSFPIFFSYLFLFLLSSDIKSSFPSSIWWYLKFATLWFFFLVLALPSYGHHFCSFSFFPVKVICLLLCKLLNNMWRTYSYDLGAPATYFGGTWNSHWEIPVCLDRFVIFYTVKI